MSILTYSASLFVLKPAQVSLTRHRSQGRRFRDVTHARVQPSGTRSWHTLANCLFMFDRILTSLRCFLPLDGMVNIYPFTITTFTTAVVIFCLRLLLHQPITSPFNWRSLITFRHFFYWCGDTLTRFYSYLSTVSYYHFHFTFSVLAFVIFFLISS